MVLPRIILSKIIPAVLAVTLPPINGLGSTKDYSYNAPVGWLPIDFPSSVGGAKVREGWLKLPKDRVSYRQNIVITSVTSNGSADSFIVKQIHDGPGTLNKFRVIALNASEDCARKARPHLVTEWETGGYTLLQEHLYVRSGAEIIEAIYTRSITQEPDISAQRSLQRFCPFTEVIDS